MTTHKKTTRELLELRGRGGETCYAIGTKVTKHWWVHAPGRTTREAALTNDWKAKQSSVSYGPTGELVFCKYNVREAIELARAFALMTDSLSLFLDATSVVSLLNNNMNRTVSDWAIVVLNASIKAKAKAKAKQKKGKL